MATPEIDIDAISEALNDKMDRDLKNRSNDSGLRKLRESYANGNDWYKIFTEIQQDGTVRTWCEQGGFAEPGTLISLLIPYSDTTYTLTVTPNGGTNGSSATTCNTYNVASTSFYFTTSSNWYSAYWKAEGYLVLNETTPTPVAPVPDAPTPIETTELQLLQQQITALQNEVANMLGRMDYTNAVQTTLGSQVSSYTCPSDGYVIPVTSSGGTGIQINGYLVHTGTTGIPYPVSTGDIITFRGNGSVAYPSFTILFCPQKTTTVSNN